MTFPVKLRNVNGPALLVLLLAFLIWRMPVDMAHNASALLGQIGTAGDKFVIFVRTVSGG